MVLDKNTDKEGDYEILDSEEYSGQQNLVFSHQSLVMKSMNRTVELCGHELSEGINETYIDPIKKITKITYKEDTKKAFINSVLACKMVMNRDFDSTAKKNIQKLFDELIDEKEKLLKEQWRWWSNLSAKRQKEMKIGQVSKTFLHKDLEYYKKFVEFEIEIYMDIFEELNNLTKRLKDYQVEELEA